MVGDAWTGGIPGNAPVTGDIQGDTGRDEIDDLDGNVAETSSTLAGFSNLSGGNQHIDAVSGNSQVAGGLQNQHTVSLQGPSSSAASDVSGGVPAGVATPAERPVLRTAINTAMTQAETLVFGSTDVESLESNEVDRLNPPGNRFGDPDYSDPFADCAADCPAPLAHECGLGGRDCNDGEAADWGSIRPDQSVDYTNPGSLEAGVALDGGTSGITQNVGSGICDESETSRCASQNCAWRQCALGSTRVVESDEDSG